MKKYFLLLTTLLVFACDSDEDKAGRFFIKGNEALNNSQLEQAVRFYSEALAIKPDYKEALNNRGVALYQDGRYTEAIIDYSNILVQVDTGYADALRNRANAYLADGQYEKALGDLAKLEYKLPDSAYVYFTKGLAYHEMKDHTQSIASFNQALEKGSDSTEVYINIANSMFMMGDFESAINRLNEAKEINADEPNIYNTLALIESYRPEPDFDLALDLVNQALKLDYNNPYFLSNRAFIYLNQSRLEEAEKDIRISIIGASDNAWAYRNRGMLFYFKEDYEAAIRNFELAADIDVNVPRMYAYWALSLQALGMKSEACDVVSNSPEDLSTFASFKSLDCQ
ncbi:tetratricopeptide repeat protein [uncultured Roseivirga sp.]|uniref:tetratricopeptide repeat protein n=1 Tax=uncultured Roseivirga sp. TaxID=543088 RepID=UPI000D794EDA|nr:tetratricopeptide repeat protein [uncultured Roseivirga sp.]PWL32177.1 MAG: hypothetical protein DCO95_03075 [Roseivirga sp. XM-24bin3]